MIRKAWIRRRPCSTTTRTAACSRLAARCSGVHSPPFLLGVPPLGGADLAQDAPLVKGRLAGVGGNADEFPHPGVGDVVPQVDQGEQHFLFRTQVAFAAAAGGALVIRALLAFLAAGEEDREGGFQQGPQGGRREAAQGAQPVFQGGGEPVRVHTPILTTGSTLMCRRIYWLAAAATRVDCFTTPQAGVEDGVSGRRRPVAVGPLPGGRDVVAGPDLRVPQRAER